MLAAGGTQTPAISAASRIACVPAFLSDRRRWRLKEMMGNAWEMFGLTRIRTKTSEHVNHFFRGAEPARLAAQRTWSATGGTTAASSVFLRSNQ